MRAFGLCCGIVLMLGCAGLEDLLPEEIRSALPLEGGDEGDIEDGDDEGGSAEGDEAASEEEEAKVREGLKAARIKVADLHESCGMLTSDLPDGELLTQWMAKLRREAEQASFECTHVEDSGVLYCEATFSSDSGDDEWMQQITFETDEALSPIDETIRCVAAG